MSSGQMLLKMHLLTITGTEEKGNWIKELKFKNCSEPMFVLKFLSNTFLVLLLGLL